MQIPECFKLLVVLQVVCSITSASNGLMDQQWPISSIFSNPTLEENQYTWTQRSTVNLTDVEIVHKVNRALNAFKLDFDKLSQSSIVQKINEVVKGLPTAMKILSHVVTYGGPAFAVAQMIVGTMEAQR